MRFSNTAMILVTTLPFVVHDEPAYNLRIQEHLEAVDGTLDHDTDIQWLATAFPGPLHQQRNTAAALTVQLKNRSSSTAC